MLWSVTMSATLTSNPLQVLRSQQIAAIWVSPAATKDRAEGRLWAETHRELGLRERPLQ